MSEMFFRSHFNGGQKMEKHDKPRIVVDLPVPSEEVVYAYLDRNDGCELILERYMAYVKDIARLEAETVVKAAKVRYGFYWKIVALVCGLLMLLAGMFMGYKIRPYWDKMGVECVPIKGVDK